MEQMRSDFEAWCQKFLGEPPVGGWNSTRYETGYYTHHIHVLWEAWQASRDAIELDLPPRKSAYASGYGDGYLVEQQGGEAIDHDETVEILRAAGLRVKEK